MAARSEFGPQGKALWKAVTDQFELAAHEQIALRGACRHADTISRLEDLLKDSLETVGAAGQSKLSPAVGELRQYRIALSKMLTDLSLPIEEAAGDVKLASPAAKRASKAASARHDRDRMRAVRSGSA